MGVWYATREAVMRTLQASYSSRMATEIDEALEAASRGLEGFLGGRRFYPQLRTIRIDWPNYSRTPSWWIDIPKPNRLYEVTSLSSGGVAIASTDYILRRSDCIDEPPYTRIELLLSTSASLQGGSTHQQNIVITGLFDDADTDTSLASGVLSGAINSAATTLVINPASGLLKSEVGSLLKIDDEWMTVAARLMSDTSQNTGGALDDLQSDQTVAVTTGSAYAVGEIIQVDAERMLIASITGNNLTVERAYDGTTLTTHTSGADIYAQRTYLVRRGQCGSTAASHVDTSSVYVHTFAPFISELCIAEATVLLEQRASAYMDSSGAGENKKDNKHAGLADLRDTALRLYSMPVRHGAI